MPVMILIQVQIYLKDTWVPCLKNSIKSCLFGVTKGWFNMKETNYEVYLDSKLKKLMELIKFAMQVGISAQFCAEFFLLERGEK